MNSSHGNVALATDRLKLWGDALNSLAQEGIADKLIAVLEAGDRKGLEALLENTRLFQAGGCIDIVETIMRVVNFGPGHFEERCDVVSRIASEAPSETDGKIYRLPDGTFVFVSERLWTDYSARAQQDPAWRDQNEEFLKAIGVLRCSYVSVSGSEVVSANKTRTICFPTVITP